MASICVMLTFATTSWAQVRHGLAGRGSVHPGVTNSFVMGRLPATTTMGLAISLPLHHQDVLDYSLKELYDPASPYYHQWLTSEQFTKLFGPTEEDYQLVADFLEAHGLEVTVRYPNRAILDVRGLVANIEEAFHIKILIRQHPTENRTFFGPDAEPTIDVDVPILDVCGLDNFVIPHPKNLVQDDESVIAKATGSGPGGNYRGNDLRAAYAPGVNLDGTGQTIGLFEFSSVCFPADLSSYCTQSGIASINITNVLLDGMTATPSGDTGEQSLDVEVAHAIAPGATILFYLGNNAADIWNRIASDNICKSVSCSFGVSPPPSTLSQTLQQMQTQGQSVYDASGDSGFTTPFGWDDNPNLTLVGGTVLTTSGAGGPYQSETGWSGSGGCISPTFTIPNYQLGIDMSANGGSTTMRNGPDVAMVADSLWVVWHNTNGPTSGGIGGTSAAAPLWAGFTALINQQAAAKGNQPVGFLNALVYQIGKSNANYASIFHDITTGNNGKPAVTGYDLVTGWGTPQGQAMIDALAGTNTTPDFSLSTLPNTVQVGLGTSAQTTVTVTSGNGFNGSVSLSASGLPSGVTAMFNPSSTTTTSMLTFTASGGATIGTVVVTITGTSGSLTHTTTVGLTVNPPPDFSLASFPTNVSLTQGSGGSSDIIVNQLFGFTNSVSLSASGLPGGVTASFAPSSTTNQSVLTLTASGTATPGTSTVTITGVSGSLTHTTTVSATVVASNAGSVQVNLSPVYNVLGIAADGSTFTNGFDTGTGANARAYPGNLLGSAVTLGNVLFELGPTNVSDSVSSTNITLPAGQFSTLQMLAAAVNGNQTAQTFVVTYTDNSTSTFSQSLSDWFTPQNFAGESTLAMAYRDQGDGTIDERTFNLYGYSFTLVSNKTVKTLTLPNNRSVIAMAVTLTGAAPPADFSLSASPGSVTVTQGGNGTSTITVNPLNGFTGSVSLSASGLPSGVTAMFNPASTTTTSVLTLTASSSAATGPATVTITGTSGSLVHTTTVSLTVNAAPDFTLSASPASVSVTQGTNVPSTITVNDLNGFNSSVSLSASGLPSGVTAAFNPSSTTTSSVLTFTAATNAATGTNTVTVTGVSGSLTHTTTVTLTVNAASSGTVQVNLSSAYNVSGIVTDGTSFSNGLDNDGNAYSFNLLGSSQNFNGVTMNLGPANAPDAVSSTNFALPSGQFTTLKMLAAAVNGNQASQVFTVTYSDSTTSTFTQSISDWATPQNFSGESNVAATAYRDQSGGTKDTGTPVDLYGYSFTLNSAKTVSKFTLPTNRNVVLLSVTLTGAGTTNFTLSAAPGSVSVSQGTNATSTITVNKLNGFNGSVSLSASGLPSGVTAAFNPSSTTTNSVLTFTASTNATTGTNTVTVKGTSGSLTNTTTITLTVTASNPDVTNGIVGYWKFNEGSGTTTADSSGNNNTGTLTNGPTWVTPGKVGAAALAFNAANLQAVNVNNSASLNVTSGITIASWINVTNWGGNRRILQKGNSDNQYRLLAENGVFKFDLSGVGTLTNALPATNTWIHIAATWNGSTMIIYTNGVQQSSLAATGTIATTTDPLAIAKKNGSTVNGDFFDGKLDDVRVYNRALSAAEVNTIKNHQ